MNKFNRPKIEKVFPAIMAVISFLWFVKEIIKPTISVVELNYFWLISSIIFVVTTYFSVTRPLAHINDNYLLLYKAALRKPISIKISSIDQCIAKKESSISEFNFSLNNGSNLKIRSGTLTNNEFSRFVEYLKLNGVVVV